MSSEHLLVWHDGGHLVGKLYRTSESVSANGLTFVYEAAWKQRGFPISQSLPFHLSPDAQQGLHFFSNLLPEGDERSALVGELRIADDDFALLKAVGGECAGALSLLPPGVPIESAETQYEPIDEHDLAEMAQRMSLPLRLTGDRRPRYSLAGAQPKVAVMVREGRMHLPKGNAPSTHVLKFESSRFKNVSLYEAFTTELASACGLACAKNQLLQTEPRPCLLSERFDRVGHENSITRLHQEDFCQALGRPSRQKYEEDEGPSLGECAALVSRISDQVTSDRQQLMQWQAFNALAGCADGHAKNISLLYDEYGGARLSPFYDLICTQAIEGVSHHLAFSVGGETETGQMRPEHWMRLAEQCGVSQDYLLNLVSSMATVLLDSYDTVRQRFESEYGSSQPALQRIQRVVQKNCRVQLRELK